MNGSCKIGWWKFIIDVWRGLCVLTLHDQNFMFSLLKHLHFEHFQKLEILENALLRTTTLCGLRKPAMSTLDVLKNGMVGGCALNNVFLHPWNVFHSCTISMSRTSEKKTLKNNEKQWKKQPWTLAYILVLQTMSSPLSSTFWFRPTQFPSKMVPYRCHLNLASIGLGSSSKGLGSNLWFLTNRNVPFCWTLDPHLNWPLVFNLEKVSKCNILWQNVDGKGG